MIVKHVAMRSEAQSQVGRLVNYLISELWAHQRVEDTLVTNCHSDDPQTASLEIANTQAMNRRALGDKTYHLIISFREEDRPTAAALKDIESTVVGGIGLGEHQRISVLHTDTDNLHLHVAVNLIHPTRYTRHEPYRAYATFAELAVQLEARYGLAKDNHGVKVRGGQHPSASFESKTGEESLVSYVQRVASDQMRGAQSWKALHDSLSNHGLALQLRGNGFVIRDASGLAVKASAVSREFSKPALEKTLGAFEPGLQTKRQGYCPRPAGFRRDVSDLYDRYQQARTDSAIARAEGYSKADKELARRVKSLRQDSAVRRRLIRVMKGGGIALRALHALETRRLRAELKAAYEQKRKQETAARQQAPQVTWLGWLQQQALNGNTDALDALRSRAQKASTPLSIGAATVGQSAASPIAVTKKGVLILSSTEGEVRDAGDTIRVFGAKNSRVLAAALVAAHRKFNGPLAVSGNIAFKKDVLAAAIEKKLPIRFADEVLDKQLLRARLSSPQQRQTLQRR